MIDTEIQELLQDQKYATNLFSTFELITFNYNISMPKDLFNPILQYYYDNLNHPGCDCTLKTILMNFYFPKMHVLIKNYVKRCLIYQQKKDKVLNIEKFRPLIIILTPRTAYK